MKKIIVSLFCFLAISVAAFSQIQNPVKWSFEAKKISETEYDFVATARIESGWFIYTQDIPSDDGPIPTKFTFQNSGQYQLVGKPKEVSSHTKSGFDKMFDMNITKYSESVAFVQRVKLNGGLPIQIAGEVEYAACNDVTCTPPKQTSFKTTIQPVAEANIPPPSVSPTNPNTQTPENKSGNMGVVPPKDVPHPETVKPAEPTINNPVTWAFVSKKVSETEYDLIFKGKIAKKWHIYSENNKYGDDGPIATSFKFDKSNTANLVGGIKEEGKKIKKREAVFNNVQVVYFEDSVKFTQRVSTTDVTKPVKGTFEYMACNEETCLPPTDVKFAFDLLTGQQATATVTPQPKESTEGGASEWAISPAAFKLDTSLASFGACGDIVSDENTQNKSLWLIFLLGFGGGLLALLTPCVFPMLPLTVSYFLHSSKSRSEGLRNAFIYGLCIIGIYVTMGSLITLFFGANALNSLSTNPWVNLIFGVLFIVFAISFFGFFEIQLPQSWVNRADSASHRGGLLGIFFMAFTLALVSFSCTGPIIGSLLVQTATAKGISAGPVVGMLGFSSALAIPFALLAAFPTLLKSLPRSGSWMDDVKVSLGFLELALALKFISNTDLIKGWKALPYEAFLGFWFLCALGVTLYFGGILHFKKDMPKPKFTAARGFMVVLGLAAMFYLGLGFRYNPLSRTFHVPELLVGIAPPAGYSYIYPQKCPLNINCFNDLNEALVYAKKANKPLMLDFTGYNCANCRKMEEYVWPDEKIINLIKDNYILVSLYTDDKTALAAPYKAYYSEILQQDIDQVGDLWTDVEAHYFNTNGQPFYALISPDGKLLNRPVAYTPEVNKYYSFLQCGLQHFNQIK